MGMGWNGVGGEPTLNSSLCAKPPLMHPYIFCRASYIIILASD